MPKGGCREGIEALTKPRRVAGGSHGGRGHRAATKPLSLYEAWGRWNQVVTDETRFCVETERKGEWMATRWAVVPCNCKCKCNCEPSSSALVGHWMHHGSAALQAEGLEMLEGDAATEGVEGVGRTGTTNANAMPKESRTDGVMDRSGGLNRRLYGYCTIGGLFPGGALCRCGAACSFLAWTRMRP
jgi:hypothetical protein